jgi:protein-disulfide isomerase
MKAFLAIGAAALALALAGCGGGDGNQASGPVSNAPLKQIPAPNGGDWTQTVVETPEGGYRMGNPDAPVKLVEYGSLGCHVCAEFSKQGSEPLQNTYVKSGQVSWEFRPFLLFPTDAGVSMLLRCQGPGPFFHVSDQLYAEQDEWMGKLKSLGAAEQQQLETMSADQRAVMLTRLTGVDQFFRQRGMPESKINACLADRAGLERLAQITSKGTEEGVSGTPTFFINGQIAEGATSWALLEPRLRRAIGE